jgi:uncharacterized membrane protein
MDSQLQRVKHELTKLRIDHEHLKKRIEKLEDDIKDPASLNMKQTFTKIEPTKLEVEPTKIKEESKKDFGIKEGKPTKQAQLSNKQDLELKIGGTWLNRIGVVAVIFGLSYFLKYSFDNEWIGPTGRVISGLLLGLIMMGAGEKLRTRYFGYAQGLLGGGSLALFFSVFASYQFYQLIPAIYAFIFLILVIVVTVFMAIRHNSLPIGILGIIGGYLTPFMIGSNDSSLWILFSYLALLTAGVLAISIFKKWLSFQYLSFIFNQVIFMALLFIESWNGLSNGVIFPFLVFLVYNFLLYLGIATVFNILKKVKANSWDISLIILNAASFFGLSLIVLEHTFMVDYLGFYAVFLSLVYIYFGKLAYTIYPEEKRQVYSLFLVSFVLITIAIPLQLTDVYISVAWLAEAVGLSYLAKKLNIRNINYSSLLVLFLGLVTAWEQIIELTYSNMHTAFLLNIPTFLLLCSILSLILIIKLAPGMELLNTTITIDHLLKVGLLILIFLGFTIENEHFFLLQDIDFFLSPEQLSLSTIWLLYALVLLVLGIQKRSRYFRYAALGLIAIVIFKAFFVDLANLATIFKILLFIVLGLFLLGISYFYQKKSDDIQGDVMK